MRAPTPDIPVLPPHDFQTFTGVTGGGGGEGGQSVLGGGGADHAALSVRGSIVQAVHTMVLSRPAGSIIKSPSLNLVQMIIPRD